jgi:hypothetical protein
VHVLLMVADVYTHASDFCCAQGDSKSPMEYIQSTEPIKVNGPVVASYGSEWLSCTAAAAAKRSSCTCSLCCALL